MPVCNRRRGLCRANARRPDPRADVIKNRFDAYRANVPAFAEQVGAEKAKFDAYEARVKGEAARGDVLESQSRAYAATVQAVTNKAEIKVKGAQIKMEAADQGVEVPGRCGRLQGAHRRKPAQSAVQHAGPPGADEGWRAKTNAVVGDG